jgi:DnaK suppressor protein
LPAGRPTGGTAAAAPGGRPGSVDDVADAPHIAILRAGLQRACTLRADLEQELADIAESTALVPDDEHDAEGSTVGYERARVTSLLSQTRQEIGDLTAALQRATGDSPAGPGVVYGQCQLCGASIGTDRLAALPATVTCVTCADGGARGGFRLVR